MAIPKLRSGSYFPDWLPERRRRAERALTTTVVAIRWFERNRAICGPPGLFSEEYDIGQRQLRGNLPQAFVHALMLETATRLAGAPPHNPVG